MKKFMLGIAAAAALSAGTAAPASACNPDYPTCDPQGTVADVLELVGQLTWPIISRLP
jgi:hypothetical protein